MLVLTRRIGQSVEIDPNVTVTVLSIEGNKVKLGFDAPPQVRVRRPEQPPLGQNTAKQEEELVRSTSVVT